MCLDPVFMCGGRLKPGAKSIQEVVGGWKNVCVFAYAGCEGARDKETLKDYCLNNGYECPRIIDGEVAD